MAKPLQTIGDWVKWERRAKRLTQERLASEAGLSRNYIVSLEAGRVHLPQHTTRQKLHRVLGTTDAELEDLNLLGRDEWGNEWSPRAEAAKDSTDRETPGIPNVKLEPRPHDQNSDQRREALVALLNGISITHERYIAFVGLIHAYGYDDSDGFEEHFFPDDLYAAPF